MKKIYFVLKEVKNRFRKDGLVMATIIFSIFISVLSILILASTMLAELNSVFGDTFLKRVYSIELEGFEDLENVLNASYLPEISSIPFLNEYYGSSDNEDNVSFNTEMKFVYDGDKEYLNSYDLQEAMVEGSNFSEEQLENGEQVIVISLDIKNKYFSTKNIADEITLMGSHYKLIGVVNSKSYPGTCFIPYTSLKYKKQMEGTTYGIDSIYLNFKNSLDNHQINKLERELKAYKNQNKEIKSDFEKMLFNYYMIAVKYILIIIAVLIFCILNIVGVFRYLVGRNIYDYVIYKLCGIENSFFITLVYLESTILLTVSFLLGTLCYKWLISFIIHYDIAVELPNYIIVICYFLTFLLISVSLIPTVEKVRRKSPVDRILWRQL